MITVSQQQWNESFKKLPEDIREALMDPDNQLSDRVNTISARHKLDDVQAARLTKLTSYLLMGFIAPTNFVATIIEELEITREEAILLAGDINRDIFNATKESLKKVHEKKGSVQKIDPSLVTCLPGEMSKEAQVANNAPGNDVAVGSIFEQKLGGAFRIKGDAVSLGVADTPTPTLVTPPAPQAVRPSIASTDTLNTNRTGTADPYRELPH